MKTLFAALSALSLAACSGGADEAATGDATDAARPAGETERGSGTFRMTVQDRFTVHQRGLVATGAVEGGAVNVGDTVCLSGPETASRKLKVEGIELFREETQSASIGDNVGLLIGDLEEAAVDRGDTLEAC